MPEADAIVSATPSASSPASDFSLALLRGLAQLGVRDIVISPGSRSQALALAAAHLASSGSIRLHVRIDERDAGFLALGLAVESRMPVAIACTSGTAVANLHPAVLEAHHSGVPLILLTADRPAEARGIGANQTTVQSGMFGAAVPYARDVPPPEPGRTWADAARSLAREVYSAAAGNSDEHGAPGPAQLNLAFREPLSSAFTDTGSASFAWASEHAATPHPLPARDHTIVIAGHGAGPRAEELARQLGAPLIAEVSSGARFGPNLVVAYRELLADPAFGGSVQRAIVFGHPTLSREVPTLLQRRDVTAVVVRGPGFEAYNPSRRAQIVDAVSYDGVPAERVWAGSWVAESRSIQASAEPEVRAPDARTDDSAAMAEFARVQLAAFREPVTRQLLVNAVWQSTWPHDRLVFGASRLIRDADRTVSGKKISVHANRGLAGIDGTISTAAGIALASEAAGSAGVTRVLLGDLTLLHDVGGMLFGVGESRPRLQVIVGNDGGGTIFDGLEVAVSAPRDAFDRVLYTPQNVRMRALADAYGWNYRLASNRGELDEALAPVVAPTLVEVPLPR